MPPLRRGAGLDRRTPTLDAVAADVRRAALAYVRAETTVSRGALADHLASTRRGASGPSRERADAIRVALVHVHLPKLADAGLVTWDETDGTVAVGPHPAHDDARFARLLALDDGGVDEAILAVSHEYRRLALATLRESQRALSRTELAEAILARSESSSRDASSVDAVALELYHTHVPTLVDWGFLESDEEDRLSYTGHAAIERVFAILTDSDEDVADRYEGFLSGLKRSCPDVSREGQGHDVAFDFRERTSRG